MTTSHIVSLDKDQHRLLVAVQYLNASQFLCEGLKRQRGVNNFHFLVTLRSFIEYTRRGIWFLAWADAETLEKATKLTFERPGSPRLATMDAMINHALGKGRVSHLMDTVQGINEPFINCLHALTHGNPISVRMIAHGLERIFDTGGLMLRAEVDLGLFKVLLYRRMVGEELASIWRMLSTVHNRPADVATNVKIAAHLLKQSGKADRVFKDQKLVSA